MPSAYIKKLLLNFIGESKSNSVNIVAQRFIKVFKDHGVNPAQIPRLMPEIKLNDLQTEASLLAVLTPEILNNTSKFFGISLKWLEGASDQIYENLACYQRLEIFFELFSAIQAGKNDDEMGIPFRILTVSKKLDGSSNKYQPLIPVLVERIAQLGDESIYRYYIFNDGFDWWHAPARIQLKAMARIVFTHASTVSPLLVVKPEELELILEGKMIPRKFLHSGLVSNPSLEDFAMPAGSPIAREVDEFPEVLKYIEFNQLENLISVTNPYSVLSDNAIVNTQVDLQPIIVTVTNNASKAAKARHAQKNSIKDRFILFYQAESAKFSTMKAAAENFFDSLDEKTEKLQFDSKDAAVRTLLDALRDFRKSENLSK